MADKTSWTKPLAPMVYGDSIVGTTRLEGGTVGGRGRSGGGWGAEGGVLEPEAVRVNPKVQEAYLGEEVAT